jgi:hypothetical protein
MGRTVVKRRRQLMGCTLLSLALSLALPLPSARAQGTDVPMPAAKEHYRQAMEHFEKGSYDQALVGFEQAWKASQSPNARLYVARCLSRMGRLAEAHGHMKGTFDDAQLRVVDDPKYQKTRDAAAIELAVLEQRVGKLVVVLHESATGARVELDGVRVAPARIGVPMAVDPGAREVVADGGGERQQVQQVDVPPGQTRVVTVVFAAETPEPTPPPPPAPVPQPVSKPAPPPPPAPAPTSAEQAPSVPLFALGFVTAGLGAVGLAAAGITGALADDELATLEERCGEAQRCTDPALADVVQRGENLQAASNAAWIAGGVLFGAGVVMVVAGWPRGKARATALAVSPAPGGAALQLRGTF